MYECSISFVLCLLLLGETGGMSQFLHVQVSLLFCIYSLELNVYFLCFFFLISKSV